MTIRHCALIVALRCSAEAGAWPKPPARRRAARLPAQFALSLLRLSSLATLRSHPTELLYNMESKPTSNSSLQRFFDAYAKLMKANRRFAPRYRVMLQQLVDKLAREHPLLQLRPCGIGHRRNSCGSIRIAASTMPASHGESEPIAATPKWRFDT